jgi:hypothetical protein
MSWRCSALFLVLCAAACEDPGAPYQGDASVSPEWVTGAAAAALDADNRFMFPPLPARAGELSRDSAVTYAEIFFADFLANSIGNVTADLQEQHGAPIDFAALRPCGRVIPIQAPFLPADLPMEVQWARNAIAAKYEVTVCQADGTKAAGVELSVATNWIITPEGHLRSPDPPIISGNEFFSFGIPRRFPRTLPETSWIWFGWWMVGPEAAVRAVYTLLRTPVRSVPQATGCHYGMAPCTDHSSLLWRMETAVPVAIRRQGAAQEEQAQEFYVRAWPVPPLVGGPVPPPVYVAARTQPKPAYLVYDYVRDQQTVVDSVLLTLSGPLAMDSFTVAAGLPP